ncbi:hypothetical protein HPB49_005708 [Dermacentor silvarum]|uniref:Uncharacterized protein n=1 Tax=Dermacentor silvarum TaxID=543639 RepID=A0ACB8C7D9_DERSI|nr:hypothetical protein HPB49_005708 [Dermacentor silvarum]
MWKAVWRSAVHERIRVRNLTAGPDKNNGECNGGFKSYAIWDSSFAPRTGRTCFERAPQHRPTTKARSRESSVRLGSLFSSTWRPANDSQFVAVFTRRSPFHASLALRHVRRIEHDAAGVGGAHSWHELHTNIARRHQQLSPPTISAASPPHPSKKSPKPPPLPANDYKIIVRIRGGLDCNKIHSCVLRQIILKAAGLPINEHTAQDQLRVNEISNTILVSTPNMDRADSYNTIRTLNFNGTTYEVATHVADPSDTCRGVILLPIDSPEQAILPTLISYNPDLTLCKQRYKPQQTPSKARSQQAPSFPAIDPAQARAWSRSKTPGPHSTSQGEAWPALLPPPPPPSKQAAPPPQIVLGCCFIGGGSVGRADGVHRSTKAPLISPSSIVDQGCLHNASTVSGKPWLNLHVDTAYRAPTSGTLTSLRRCRHAGFLGIKEAAAATDISGLGGTAVTMLAHVPLYMQVSDKK